MISAMGISRRFGLAQGVAAAAALTALVVGLGSLHVGLPSLSWSSSHVKRLRVVRHARADSVARPERPERRLLPHDPWRRTGPRRGSSHGSRQHRRRAVADQSRCRRQQRELRRADRAEPTWSASPARRLPRRHRRGPDDHRHVICRDARGKRRVLRRCRSRRRSRRLETPRSCSVCASRRFVVVDAGAPRNAPAAHMHGYLSRDGMPPADLLAAGRREATSYGVEFIQDSVTEIETGFSVRLGSGRVLQARRILHRHRCLRRVSARPRCAGALGSVLPALPVLPWLGGSRSASRRSRNPGRLRRARAADPPVVGRPGVLRTPRSSLTSFAKPAGARHPHRRRPCCPTGGGRGSPGRRRARRRERDRPSRRLRSPIHPSAPGRIAGTAWVRHRRTWLRNRRCRLAHEHDRCLGGGKRGRSASAGDHRSGSWIGCRDLDQRRPGQADVQNALAT